MEPTVEPRSLCRRCLRPERVCYCDHLPSLETRTRLVFLQHLRERRMPIGTARMAHLALPNSEFHVGVDFTQDERIARLPEEAGTFILFPGPRARDVTELRPGELRQLVVVDGTWPLAKKLIRVNPVLTRLPQVAFHPERPGNYRIRKEPAEHCLSTIEAVSEMLGHLEGDRERFQEMLRAFEVMVDRQIAFAEHRAGPSRYKANRRRPYVPVEVRLAEWTEALWPKLVLVYGESNALPEGDERRHELIHLCAVRPATGERFEALLRPEGALDESTPHHLELPAERIRAGEDRDEGLRRWAAFLREDDVLAGWGFFTLSLLRPHVGERRFEDLRQPVVRRLGRRPGGLDEAAALFGSPPPDPDGGRAARRLRALEQVAAALRAAPT